MLLHRRPNVFLLLILSYIILSASNVIGESSSSRAPRANRFKEPIKHDIARYKWIAHKVKSRPKTTRRMAQEEEARLTKRVATQEEPDVPIEERQGPPKSTIDGSIKLPLSAAKEFRIGEYVVELDVGNPPQKLRLIIDTGSDVTWVKCKNLPKGAFAKDRGFQASHSSSFQPITCDTMLCKQDFQLLNSLQVCPNPNAPCLYNISYGLGGQSSGAYGIFSKETATLPTTKGKKVTLPNFLLGCTQSFGGEANLTAVDGIMGLGISPYSFSTLAVNKFGGTFSYCLVDHLSLVNKASYLIFGDMKEKAPTAEYIRYTALRVKDGVPYMWVIIKGVSVGNRMLDIPRMVWGWNFEEDGGTIIDSGTSVTYWMQEAYRPIMDALIAILEKDYPKLPPDSLGDGREDFEYCFNSTLYPFNKAKMPRLQIHFTDGARFQPHVQSYIVDDGEDVYCIGFLSGPGSFNVIGNILQQNYLWEFDLHYQALGFYPSTCT